MAGEINESVMAAFATTATNEERLDMLIEAVARIGDDALGEALAETYLAEKSANREVTFDAVTGEPLTSDRIGREEFEEAQLNDATAAQETVPEDDGTGEDEVESTVGQTELGSQS